MLWIPAELGGQVTIDERGYIRGAPELVVEIARSSRAFDLGPKKADYERAGVLEYLVDRARPRSDSLVPPPRRALRGAACRP